MARIRSIKPEFCSSADTGALSREARLFFLQLLTEADDHGRLLWIARRLCGVLYPHDEDVTAAMLTEWMHECVARGMLIHYKAGPSEILQITNWAKHQRVDKPTASRLPEHSSQGVTIVSREVREAFARGSREARETLAPDLGREGEGEGEREVDLGVSSLRSDSSATCVADLPADETKPELKLAPPADLKVTRAGRIREIAEQAQSAYNAILAKPTGLLPMCAVMNKPRLKAVEQALPTVREICLKLYGSERVTPQFWTEFFEEAARDDWHSGRVKGGPGHEKWKPDFDFLLREGVIAKLFDRAMTDSAAA